MASNQQSGARRGQTPATKVADDAAQRKEALKAWAAPEPSAFHQRNSNSNTAQAQAQAQAQPKVLHDAENSKTPGHNPDSAHFSKKFPCTYEGCGRRFDEVKSLKRHKDAEHAYCKLCDKDCKDEEALHLHKMQSEKHVVCNICGVDFMSEPGRDRHYRQVSLSLLMYLDIMIHLIQRALSIDSVRGQVIRTSTLSADNETLSYPSTQSAVKSYVHTSSADDTIFTLSEDNVWHVHVSCANTSLTDARRSAKHRVPWLPQGLRQRIGPPSSFRAERLSATSKLCYGGPHDSREGDA